MITNAASLFIFVLFGVAAPVEPDAQPVQRPDAVLDDDGGDPAEGPAPSPTTDPELPSPAGTEDTAGPAPQDEPEASPPKTPAAAEGATTAPAPLPETTTEASDTEPGAADGDLTLDDIFGAPEEHTTHDTPPAEEGGAAPGTPAVKRTPDEAAPRAAGNRFLDKLDTRFRILSSVHYDVHKTDERRFSRNENRLEFYFAYTPNEHLQIVGDIEPVFQGVTQPQALNDLASRRMLTPFHIESDAAYIAVNDLLPKLDLKVGRQILVWGTADKFNPTNNINPDDLEDRPLFTEPIANQMVVVDYAPLDDKLFFQGVYVPIFFPALLPPSAAAGLTDPQSPVPFARQSDRDAIGELQDLLRIQPGLVPTVTANVAMPRNRFVDGQSAIKLGTSLGGVDLSFSYYNGRHDIPTPVRVESSTKNPPEGPPDEAQCCYRSDVTLVYPRMQVLGFDFSTQLPFLGNMGLWGEGGLFFPNAKDLYIEFPIAVDVTPDDGEANPVTSLAGPNITKSAFIKATAGFDYTFGKHVYVQLQYLRGFIDEFGAEHIGNYLVGGSDLIFFGRHMIFRAFGVVDLPTGPGDDGSYVIYPELMLTPPWGSVTLHLGSFFLLGNENTKFGQPATGSSIVFAKVVGTF